MGLAQDGKRERLDSLGRGIGSLPGAEKGLETKVEGAKGIHARVHGPQPGERLRHVTEGVFHCARSDGPSTGSEAACAILLGEKEKDWDRVGGDGT